MANTMTREEATRWVYERYKKLAADRRDVATRFKQTIDSAADEGYAPAALRLCARLDAMTPDARAKWCANIQAAAKVFGSAGLATDLGPATKESDPQLWPHLQKFKHYRKERLAITGALRELSDTAKENSVNLQAIKDVIRLQQRADRYEPADDEEPKQPMHVFDEIDEVGRIIGAWK